MTNSKSRLASILDLLCQMREEEGRDYVVCTQEEYRELEQRAARMVELEAKCKRLERIMFGARYTYDCGFGAEDAFLEMAEAMGWPGYAKPQEELKHPYGQARAEAEEGDDD